MLRIVVTKKPFELKKGFRRVNLGKRSPPSPKPEVTRTYPPLLYLRCFISHLVFSFKDYKECRIFVFLESIYLKKNKLKLFIKYMVSIRCQMVVKVELEKLGIRFSKVEIGEVE